MSALWPAAGNAALAASVAATGDRRPLSGVERWVVLTLVLACAYPLLMAGVHTNLMPVGAALLGLAEACILAMCLPLMLRHIPGRLAVLVVMALAVLTALWLVRDGMDFKAVRDFVIPACFLWLGMRMPDRAVAERCLLVIGGIALAMGVFELLFVDVYSRIFNILSYYVAQGTVLEAAVAQQDVALSFNGVRPEGIGRTFFPALLGNHRVSSVFIEPVSMGNFATLLAAWGLSKGPDERGRMWLLLGLAWCLIVLADSRYGLVVVSLMVAMRLTSGRHGQGLAFAFPFVAVLMVSGLALAFPGYVGDNFLGRLVWSGHALLDLGWSGLLGLDGWATQHGDSGYAYVFTRFSLPLAVAVWLFVWMLPVRDEAAARFRAHASLYMALILTISGTSLFAMKTSALLWFLIGVGVAGSAVAPSAYAAGRARPTPFPAAGTVQGRTP